MSGYFEELQKEQAKIERVLSGSGSQEELFDQLRADGVKTTQTRLAHFCERVETEIKDMEVGVVSPPSGSLETDYPQFVPHRELIFRHLLAGTTPLEVWAFLRSALELKVNQEQVADYCERLIASRFPAREISPTLYSIPPTTQTWPSDMPLVNFSDGPTTESWTVADVSQGIAIFGAPGSGKTTGSGRLFAARFLSAGFGGLILTAKQQETSDWMKLCDSLGRAEDTAVVELKGCVRLNFLEYEASHPGLGSSITSNLVQFFQNLLSVVSAQRDQGMNDDFWKKTGQQLLSNLFDTFTLAKEPITLDGLCEFVDAAPQSLAMAKEGSWENLPYFGDVLTNAAIEAGRGTPADKRIFAKVSNYWLTAFATLAAETRSCITINFSAISEVLRQRHVYELMSSYTTITPEQILGGKVVIVNLPINEFHEAGLLVQAAWKYLLQRAILRRKDVGDSRRPVFIWEDEGQNFIINQDNEFQAVCREYRAAKVLITQNLNNLYARFGGGDYARTKVDALLANINTKIFHANGDQTTNKWASDYFGDFDKIRIETSKTEQSHPGFNPIMDWLMRRFKKPVASHSERISREPIIRPQDFMGLQRGEPGNGYVNHAFVSQIGRKLFGAGYFAQCTFKQFDLSGPVFPKEIIERYAKKLDL